MQCSIQSHDLLRALARAHRAATRGVGPLTLSAALLEVQVDRVAVSCTDLELAMRSVIEARVVSVGRIAVPARRMLSYVRALPDEPIRLTSDGSLGLIIESERARTRIPGLDLSEMPVLPAVPPALVCIPAAAVSSAIARTICAVPTEQWRYSEHGALMVIQPDRFIMVATDGHRLALYETPVNFDCESAGYRALVPKKAMAELQKLTQDLEPEEKVAFCEDDNHLFFSSGERLLISRKLTASFPDYERVLPSEHPHTVHIRREELRETVERVAQFADEQSHAIRLQFSPGAVKAHSSLAGVGESEETLPVVYDGPRVEICFNARYLAEFLRAAGEDEIIFRFRDASSAAELRPVGEKLDYVYRYVVMPMRIPED